MFGSDRGASVTAMAEAFTNWLRRQGDIVGVISAGGSGGASLVAPAHARAADRRAQAHRLLGRLGRRRALCRPADITMMYSVTDVQGLNSISRQVLANGANALVGMVKARLDARAAKAREPGAACPRSA